MASGSAEKNDGFIQSQAGYGAFTHPFARLKRHIEEQKNTIVSLSADLWSSDVETKMFFLYVYIFLKS